MLEELQMIEIKESEAFILQNMENLDEIKKEKKAHKQTLTKSRVEELRRIRVTKASKKEEIRKKKEETIADAAKLWSTEPGRMINWNQIVTAKREKLREFEQQEEQERKKDNQTNFEDMKDFVFQSMIENKDTDEFRNAFSALRLLQPHPLPQAKKEFEVTRKFHINQVVNPGFNKVEALKQKATRDYLREN